MTPPAIILSHPQMGENVGAAARAMKNFGLSELVLIAPKCGWPNDKAQMVASGSGDIIEAVKVYDTAAEALAPFNLVLATTARDRDILPCCVAAYVDAASNAAAVRRARGDAAATARVA